MTHFCKRLLALCLCLVLTGGLFLQAAPGAKAVDYLNTLPQSHYGEYGTVNMVKDVGSCYSMQGMTVDTNYVYCAKIGSNDAVATIVRLQKTDGALTYMTNTANSTQYFYNLGHANALDITNVNGANQMFVTAGTTLVRLTMSGTSLTTAGTYTFSINGTSTGMTAVQLMSVSPTEVKVMAKSGRTIYTGTLDPRVSSGDIALTKLCTLDITNVRLKGSMIDYSAFTQQGFDYHDGKLFLPLSGNANEATINYSVVLVYDMEGASGTVRNDPTLSFRIISGTYAGLFEIEDVAVCNTDGKLYFSSNRRKTASDTNYDACSYFMGYVYDPAMSTLTPADYRWETVNNEWVSSMDGGNTFNNPIRLYGSISDNTMSLGIYHLSRSITLMHDIPWVVEWKSSGTFGGGAMLLSGGKTSTSPDKPYLFRYKESQYIALGYYTGSQHNNYGIMLSDHGIDGTAEHVYRLTNKIASDGTNMVYLSVDGVELGAMNNYYIGTKNQNTTDNWVSGKDFTFSYQGAFGNPINSCKLDYLQVWADGEPEDVADIFRWETTGDDFVSVTGSGYTQNTPYIYNGSISGTTHSATSFRLTESVVLRHDRNWSVRWESGANSSGTFLLSGAEGNKNENAPFLFRYGNNLFFLGAYDGTQHANCGIDISDYGIDGSVSHVYTLFNKPASDGTNMVYMSVDGVELGAMNNFYSGISDKNTTSDWLSGRDLVFDYVGNRGYALSGDYTYLQVVEDCSHSFSDWQGTNADCSADGRLSRSCTLCGHTEAQVLPATGHSYTMTTQAATCTTYAQYTCTCSTCGKTLTYDAGQLAASPSETVPEGMDESLFEIQTQYRYSDYQTVDSYETSLEGYTLKSSQWVQTSTGSVTYVPTWASGFDTTSSVYAQYNQTKVTASETATDRTVIDSDALVGYLWYHWCSTSSSSSWASKTDTYNIFHTYYGTTAPSNYECDTFDYSYKTNHSSCSNAAYWFPMDVYRQDYTTSKNLFTYERWTDYSAWSDTAVTASDTRKVETRTVCQLKDAALSSHSYTTKVTAPTCTEKGYTTYTCSQCGDSYQDKETAATGHSYKTVTVNATCTAAGSITETCSTCGDKQVQTIPATGHTEVIDRAVAATCTTTGLTEGAHCSDCGEVLTAQQVIAAKGHSYSSAVTTAPGCESAGVRTFTCGSCGDTYTEAIAATGHTEVIDRAVAATCTTTGLTEGAHCSDCNAVLTAQQVIAAKGHSYSSAVTTAPGCESAGVRTFTCGSCGDTYTEAIAATGHTEVIDRAVAATCTTTGLTEGAHCSVCNAVLTAQQVIAAKGHSYSSAVTTAPGCESAGVRTFTCSSCGDTYTEAIAATGHTEVIDRAVAATCTTTGLTEGAHCSDCGKVLTAQETIPAIGHKYIAKITTDPGCDSAGVKTFTCENCGDTYTEPLAATGHNYEATTTVAPTCTEQGYTTYACPCGDTYNADYTDALGHTEEIIHGTAATCTETGLTDGVKCSVCGETLTAQKVIPATGHTEETVPGYAATCTETGLTDGVKCSVCDETLTAQEVIPATGHTEETIPGTAADCTNTGLTDGVKCSVCGETLVAQEIIPATGHTEETVPGYAATCTTPGLTDGVKCSVCGETLTAQEEIPALGHTEEIIPGTAAGCITPGLTDGAKCSVCGETLTAQEEIPALGHTEETVPGYAADCTNPGLTDGVKCSVCGETLTAQEEIPALGHTEETVPGTAATCTETGLTDGAKCSVCGEILTAQEIIPATGHTEETVLGTAADCVNPGLTDGVKCSVCGEIITAQEEIPALGHTEEIIPGTAADCTTPGLTDGVKCSVCDEILVAQEAIPATGHTEETIPGYAATCTETGLTDGAKCSICGEILTAQEVIPATGHTEETIPGYAADCINPGLTDGVKCSVCGETLVVQETIPATGHSFADGICTVCGEADPDYVAPVVPTLKPSFPTLTFEDVITMNVYFQATDLDNVVEMGLITYSSSVTDYSVETAEAVIPGYRYSDSYQMYVVSTNGIAAKNMSDEIFFSVYAKQADGSYVYSKLLSYSPTSYAYDLLDTAEDDVKQLMVAMLNYGAEAQTFFSYRTDALMNADLTDEQKSSIEGYRSDMMAAISTVDADKAINFTRTASGFTSRYPSISFEGAFEINYYCVPSAVPAGEITLYYWDQTDYDAADVLSVDNATGAIAMTEGTDRYEAAVTGIAAKDLDKGIYVAFVYTDGTNTYCSGILGYSIGAYCVDQAATGAAIAPFAQATAVYGYYAKQTFYK